MLCKRPRRPSRRVLAPPPPHLASLLFLASRWPPCFYNVSVTVSLPLPLPLPCCGCPCFSRVEGRVLPTFCSISLATLFRCLRACLLPSLQFILPFALPCTHNQHHPSVVVARQKYLPAAITITTITIFLLLSLSFAHLIVLLLQSLA